MPDLPDSRYPRPARPGRPENPPADRQMASDLASAFCEHDLAELRRLPRGEVVKQRETREDLYQYISELYECIREREGVRSPAWHPEYSVVGSMLILVRALCDNAGLVMQESEDDLGN